PEPVRRSRSAPPIGRTTAGVMAGVIVALAGVAAVSFLTPSPPPRRTPPPAVVTVPASEAPLPPSPPHDDVIAAAGAESVRAVLEPMKLLSIEEIVTKSLPSVVTVETDDGIGSGFFVAPGTVVTNSHVVRGSSTVTLRRSGGYMRAARVEANSPEIDLAILKVDIVDLDQPVLPLGSPS